MGAWLNHIGIAFKAPEQARKLFTLLGIQQSHSEPVPDQGVVTHFFPLPAHAASLEFLEPVDPQGVIAQFLAKRGPGVHHLAFEVTHGELDATCERVRQAGFKLVYEQPRKGAHAMRINFVHPASTGGLLVEILERGA